MNRANGLFSFSGVEFYCKVKQDNWQVCRRCTDTNIDCDGTSLPEDGCTCSDIKLVDPEDKQTC